MREGVEYVGRGGGTQGSKVHYARRCANFNLREEGGNKVEENVRKRGDDRDQESTKEGGKTVSETSSQTKHASYMNE